MMMHAKYNGANWAFKCPIFEPSESVPDEMMQDQPLKDDPKDTSAKIASKISNAAERKPAETMASLRKGIVRKPGLVIERWDGVDGYDINTLTKSPRFPTLPNFQDYVDTYSEPDNWGDSFGSRIRGYFCPDQTGNHIFQIASDAQGQLYLSPDENPAHKVMIAEISGDRVVPPRVYNKYREQTSQFVYLEKDKCYYTSAIHKEQFLDDNLSVKVIMPDKRSFDPIPKQFLWTLPKPKPTEPEGSGDPMGLLRVAAKAGARAGAKLGMEEAAKKGAEAGAIAGEKAGVQAGAQAGAVAARKAATEIAVKALQQIMANMTSNKHVVNVYTSANGSSSSAATTNVNVNAGANSNAAGKANASGEGQGTGTGTPGGPGGPGGDGSTGKGKPGGTDGGAPGITKPVLEPKSGENIKKLAEKYTTKSGSAKRTSPTSRSKSV
ncbi:N-acetyl-beta-glucosaminyl-glycoprotein 4-beta-N-acetylgalactosaminyltransferase 1 [Exaiptasia diaphana]|nr:N-acetyl-beta-glucosaminyl-glycoprotein 4-beta-N-acetylgalactosaminyltransferase 1 [Exaiptasia diaphana]